MILEVREIYKRFGGNRVLEGVSFSAEEGEIVGIIGPNGSGKTTLMNIISGTVREDEGEIFLDGRKINNLKPHQRAWLGLGRTFQITRLFSNLRVLENVLIALHYGGRKRADRRQALEILEMVGLDHKADDFAGSLSLAQRKRLELARALALKPKVLLLDEVFAGLNPQSVKEIVELLERLNSERRITMILVEHVLKALFSLTKRVIVLAEGRAIYEGDPQGMRESKEVVKAYLGERYLKNASP